MYICVCVCVTIKGRKDHEFETEKGGYMGGIREKKWEGQWYNYIKISKK